MRISLTERWLAVVLSLGIRGVNGKPNLHFDDAGFMGGHEGDTNRPAIFILTKLSQNAVIGGPVPRSFNWKTDGQLQVDEVRLYTNSTTWNGRPIGTANDDSERGSMENPNGVDFSTKTNKPSSTSPTSASQSIGVNPQLGIESPHNRQGNPSPEDGIKLTLNVTGSNVIIDDMTQLKGVMNQFLYFAADWHWPGGNGTTYSRFFTLVDNDNEYDRIAGREQFNSTFYSNEPARSQEATSFPSSPSRVPFVPVPSASAAPQPEESPSGGLATGAIIGIAVACGIVGLVLIGALIWLLLRRRRQTTNAGGPGRPYGIERNRTEELMAEKEASAGADPSPHSPYSDEGILAGSPAGTHHEGAGIPVGGAVPVLSQQIPRLQQPHDQPRSYTPYSDRASGGGVGSPSTHAASIAHSDDIPRTGMGSPTAGRATPHGSLAPQYAHLVEEGMTEEEIRRLEDEERQLDAAIEQAGRR